MRCASKVGLSVTSSGPLGCREPARYRIPFHAKFVPLEITLLESASIYSLAEVGQNKARFSLELGVFGLGLLEDRDIGVSIFP